MSKEGELSNEKWVAVVGLRFPDSPEGVEKARVAEKKEDFDAISWKSIVKGDPVPDYIIEASPWLVDQGKVEKAPTPVRPAPAPVSSTPAPKKNGS